VFWRFGFKELYEKIDYFFGREIRGLNGYRGILVFGLKDLAHSKDKRSIQDNLISF
jgi:hypothetical protein